MNYTKVSPICGARESYRVVEQLTPEELEEEKKYSDRIERLAEEQKLLANILPQEKLKELYYKIMKWNNYKYLWNFFDLIQDINKLIWLEWYNGNIGYFSFSMNWKIFTFKYYKDGFIKIEYWTDLIYNDVLDNDIIIELTKKIIERLEPKFASYKEKSEKERHKKDTEVAENIELWKKRIAQLL